MTVIDSFRLHVPPTMAVYSAASAATATATATAAAEANMHHHHPDNFRSAVYRSLKKTLLAGCQDPSDHVETAAVRRYNNRGAPPPPPPPPLPPSTAMVSVGCGGGHHYRGPHQHRNYPTSGDEPLAGSIRYGGGGGGEGTTSSRNSSTDVAAHAPHLSRVSREAETLQRVVDFWARQEHQHHHHHNNHPRSMDVAEGLLRGALELQESLALLRELHEVAGRSTKRRSRQEGVKSGAGSSSAAPVAGAADIGSGSFDARNYHRIYDNPWHSISSGSGSRREDEFKKPVAHVPPPLQQRQYLPAPSSSEENTYFTRSLRFSSSSGGTHFRSKSDSSDDSAEVSFHKKTTTATTATPTSSTTRYPNLIVKLMGLEDAPSKAIQPVDKQVVVVSSNHHFDAKMPRARKSQQQAHGSDGKTFQEMIDKLKIKGTTPEGREKAVRRASMDDDSIFTIHERRPPIVVIKPMLRSFDEEVMMRKDIHVDNNAAPSASNREEVVPEATKVVDKEIVMDQNKKTLVKMLEGKQKKNDDKGGSKTDYSPHNNKMMPPRTKLPAAAAAETQRPNTPPPPPQTKVRTHQLPFRRKTDEIKSVKKHVLPTADARPPRPAPVKVQKQQQNSVDRQAVHKTSTSAQNRVTSLDHLILAKEKRKTRSRPQKEAKPPTEIKMVPAQNNTTFVEKNLISYGNINPSPSPGFTPSTCLLEKRKQENRIPREDGREKESDSIDELIITPSHNVELPSISQEERDILDDPNCLEKVECSPCHDVELETPSQETCIIVNDRITATSESGGDREMDLPLSTSLFENNADEASDFDEAQATNLPLTLQDNEIGNSKLLVDCCVELLQCRSYHMKLSNLAMLCSHAQNTYSLYSQDELDEEVRRTIENFRSYIEPTGDSASLGGLYWRLQVDLNCNGLMGIGGWDCGWIDGVSVEEVEKIVSNIEECIAFKLIEEVTLELCSPL